MYGCLINTQSLRFSMLLSNNVNLHFTQRGQTRGWLNCCPWQLCILYVNPLSPLLSMEEAPCKLQAETWELTQSRRPSPRHHVTGMGTYCNWQAPSTRAAVMWKKGVRVTFFSIIKVSVGHFVSPDEQIGGEIHCKIFYVKVIHN